MVNTASIMVYVQCLPACLPPCLPACLPDRLTNHPSRLPDASGATWLQLAAISQALAEADKCLVDGADEMLQLLNAAAKMQQAFNRMA